MTNSLTTPRFLRIHSHVAGHLGGSAATILIEDVPLIMSRLAAWKLINSWKNTDWAEMTLRAVERCTSLFGEMAVRGVTADHLDPYEQFLSDRHSECLVWLLHSLGKLEEAIQRSNREAVEVRVTSGRGMRGVRVSFAALPEEVVAANDNRAATRH